MSWVRAKKLLGIARLDLVKATLDYSPLTTDAMIRAAEFWAVSRNLGLPTAPPEALDGDCILAAQASVAAVPNVRVTVATDNIAHLNRFVVALPCGPDHPLIRRLVVEVLDGDDHASSASPSARFMAASRVALAAAILSLTPRGVMRNSLAISPTLSLGPILWPGGPPSAIHKSIVLKMMLLTSGFTCGDPMRRLRPCANEAALPSRLTTLGILVARPRVELTTCQRFPAQRRAGVS